MNRRSFLLSIPVTLLGIYMSPLQGITAWASPNRPKTLPLNTARFAWDWSQGAFGNVEQFELVCGNIRKVLSDPSIRSVLIKDIFTHTGTYTNCTIVARSGIKTTQAAIPFTPIHVDREANIVTLLG
jgi:hypothetical protein